jgi:hypothetical protein
MAQENANDRLTNMTDMVTCMNKLLGDGFVEQFKVEKGRLYTADKKKHYKPNDIKMVNFYRFEGPSNPDDMSILYAVETVDGVKGTLVDAYGLYADEGTGAFMQEVEIHKKAVSPMN